VTILRNDKAKFKVALRKYQHTHCVYCVDEFFMRKDDLQYFCKMFELFDTVNLYICVFMTCSTSCCLYDTLMDSWNVCMYVWSNWMNLSAYTVWYLLSKWVHCLSCTRQMTEYGASVECCRSENWSTVRKICSLCPPENQIGLPLHSVT